MGLSAAYSVKDVQFVRIDRRLKALGLLHAFVAEKDIYVRADLALLVQYPLAESRVPRPKVNQRVADSRRSIAQPDLRFTAGKCFQMAA